MTPWLDDGDIRLYHGDALETVRGLPDGSVDCVVTSPPYWGLRDYGIDGQMGLEESPDEFVTGMVELFREIRRVLAPHGTCWVNLGDSYATGGNPDTPSPKQRSNQGSLGTLRSVPPEGLKQKDLCGIPWRVAFALQADGWWLRSDVIWAKPNPMPESVTDRPTKAHEYVFLLTKQPRYWFDAESVREAYQPDSIARDGRARHTAYAPPGQTERAEGERCVNGGRNVRSVWQIATQPYPEAHFATYPEELARRCILAGCPVRVCRVCGKPSERIVDVSYTDAGANNNSLKRKGGGDAEAAMSARPYETRKLKNVDTVGWSDCGCDQRLAAGEHRRLVTKRVDDIHAQPATVGTPTDGTTGEAPTSPAPAASRWRPGTVLDPFIGSGTTAKVARDHQRHAIGIDLNHEYLELAARRLQQLSLLT